jgi:hypothetical protein
VVPHFYMFDSGVKHGVFGNINGTRAIKHERYMEHSSPKSLSVYVIQSSCEQQLAAATYSASVVDWATLDCLRADQETSKEPRNRQVPEVDFRSTRHPAKSAFEKPINEREKDAEYQRPSSEVY